MLGDLELKNDDWVKAKDTFRAAKDASNEKDSYATLCLGNWNYFAAVRSEKRAPKLEATHLEKSKELYTKVLVEHPANMYAANGAGVVLAEKGQFDVANELFKQSSGSKGKDRAQGDDEEGRQSEKRKRKSSGKKRRRDKKTETHMDDQDEYDMANTSYYEPENQVNHQVDEDDNPQDPLAAAGPLERNLWTCNKVTQNSHSTTAISSYIKSGAYIR
ncbi:binding protein [Artemisia annua]|uniref:Binding protein n=1 Tax=Artemisia annua TaxID=35608 RepID=A0A2U1KGN5_ARTAN|nr:binding protein [Artemisia annua]